jgi:hypothetical protein
MTVITACAIRIYRYGRRYCEKMATVGWTISPPKRPTVQERRTPRAVNAEMNSSVYCMTRTARNTPLAK